MPLFDTHCHLDDEQFSADRAAVIQRAADAGVATIVAVGVTTESSQDCAKLAEQNKTVVAAVGIQPNYCAEAQPGDWDRIVALADRPHVVALGETGLDRYWDYAPFELQQDFFDRHVRLSQQRDVPFIVHMRECESDILVMLREARQRGALRGVMHSFTGSADTARECVELGLYISFAGMVTYKKSADLRDVAAQIPDDRILIETDAPYLSPHPKRAQRPNEPSLVVHTAECLAQVRGTSLDQFAAQSTQNAKQLFRQD